MSVIIKPITSIDSVETRPHLAQLEMKLTYHLHGSLWWSLWSWSEPARCQVQRFGSRWGRLPVLVCFLQNSMFHRYEKRENRAVMFTTSKQDSHQIKQIM